MLKHKSNVEFKASFAALCVAKLQDLWTQTKEQLRETDTEFRIFPVFVPLHSKVFWYNLKMIHNLLSVTHLKYMLSTTPFSSSSFLFFFFFLLGLINFLMLCSCTASLYLFFIFKIFLNGSIFKRALE